MHFGGCCKQGLLTKLRHSFIDVQNVDTHGGTIHDKKTAWHYQ
jgi:hypothetical protein